MPDTFYALSRSHLIGQYEVSYEHLARPMVESVDGGEPCILSSSSTFDSAAD